MKKRLVFLIIIGIIAIIGAIILFTPVYDILMNIKFLNPYMLKLNSLLNQGDKFYESIYGGYILFFSIIFTIFALSFLFTKKVDDSTMPALMVEQKIVAVNYNKKDTSPKMVVVYENVLNDGGNINEEN